MNAKEHNERNSKFVWQDMFMLHGPKAAADFRMGQLGANHDNGDGKGFRLSAKMAARETPYSEKTCEDAIRRLRQAGWFRLARRGGRSGDGTVRANEWVLAIPPEILNPVAQVDRAEDVNPVAQVDRAASTPLIESLNPVKLESQPTFSEGPLDPVTLDPFSLDPQRRRRLTKASDLVSLREAIGGEIETYAASRDVIGGEVRVKPCGCGEAGSCPDCREGAEPTSKAPEWKQERWHNELTEREGGLDATTGTPIDDKPAVGYRSRSR